MCRHARSPRPDRRCDPAPALDDLVNPGEVERGGHLEPDRPTGRHHRAHWHRPGRLSRAGTRTASPDRAGHVPLSPDRRGRRVHRARGWLATATDPSSSTRSATRSRRRSASSMSPRRLRYRGMSGMARANRACGSLVGGSPGTSSTWPPPAGDRYSAGDGGRARSPGRQDPQGGHADMARRLADRDDLVGPRRVPLHDRRGWCGAAGAIGWPGAHRPLGGPGPPPRHRLPRRETGRGRDVALASANRVARQQDTGLFGHHRRRR